MLPPRQRVDQRPPAPPPDASLRLDPVEEAVAGLVQQGWAVIDDFLAPSSVVAWRQQAVSDFTAGRFRPADVGRGSARERRPEIRADHIRWLEPEVDKEVPSHYWQQMERLRIELNRAAFLGLVDLEAHLALYPPSAGYRCHLDRFESGGARTVSVIVYLNETWCEADGGALRLYLEDPEVEPWHDVFPIGGRIVCFLSAQFHHEVLSATRDRLSVTGWFLKRGDLL